MGLENARDSYNDLLQMQLQQQAAQGKQQRRQEEGKLMSGQKQTSGSLALSSLEDLLYEPCDVEEDEDHWPVWEMAGDVTWRDQGSRVPSSKAASTISAGANGGMLPISECERIFTVPEVYEEMQRHNSSRLSSMMLPQDSSIDAGDEGACQHILSCFNPWRRSNQGVLVIDDDTFKSLSETMSMNDIQEGNQREQKPSGVMKRTSMAVQLYLGLPSSERQSFTPSTYKIRLDNDAAAGGGRNLRASIIGSDRRKIYVKDMDDINDEVACGGNTDEITAASQNKNRVHFSELKKVLHIRKFTPDEAVDVWFQREDFDYFKNEMTLLIQQDCTSQELAAAWLDAKQNGQRNRSADRSSKETGDTSITRTNSSTSNSRSWWHDYDHSRRGLERYASPGQARQILASYKVAVQKVLQEQRRQSMLRFFCVPNARDPEKIAEVYHEYTAWSRDLALAAGASDADAVQTNFDDNKRHTREYYMLKQVVASGYKVHKHMPEFMMPKCITPKGFLDEAESMYDDTVKSGDGKKTNGTNFFETVVGMTLAGAEAREEMSRLDSVDLEGPVSPALVPILQIKKDNEGRVFKSSKAAQGELPKQKTMAEKAKNYPFQE